MKSDTTPRMMRMKQLTNYTSLSRAYIYQKIAEGEFPPGSMISSGIRIWDRATVDSWLDERTGRNL
jgi:predicted DNA-binding transcriptional regulator AlpA